MQNTRNSHSLLVRIQKWNRHTLEDSFVVPHKSKSTLTTWYSSCSPWCLPKAFENLGSHENLHKSFIAALFIFAKTWKQPRCLSLAEKINKQWYIQSMEYYLVLKRDKLSSHKKTWRASLVAQWLGICLTMQGTWVSAPVREDPTCRGVDRPVSHNHWACASGACAPQQ